MTRGLRRGKQSERLEVVAELASLVNTSYDLHAIFRTAIQTVRRVIDFRRASVVLVSEDRATYSLHTLYDDARGGFLEPGGVFPVNAGLTGEAIRSGRPIKEDRFGGYNDLLLDREGPVAVLILPLRVEGEVIGALNLGGRRAAQYRESDLRFAALLARQIETSLQYSRLLARLAEQRDAVQAQHARGESERARLAALIEASQAAVMLVSGSRVEHANGLMAELLGLPREVVVGSPMRRVERALQRALASSEMLEAQRAAVRRGGMLKDRVEFAFPTRGVYERVVAPVHDPGGSMVGHVVIYRNVTQEADVEAAKDEFVSIVSHELRTPLTSVRTSLGLLRRGASGDISEESKELVDIGMRNVERLIRLVDDLLDVSRIKSGRLDLWVTAVPVNGVVYEALDATQGFADERQVTIDVLPAATDLWVQTDGDRLVQVLVNLLSNAIKFSPSGSRVVLSWSADGEFVRLDVSDQGPGIAADKIESVFERFRQLEPAATRRHGGAGLGLAISRAIIERLGGELTLQSEEGRGSCFRVRLARAPVPNATLARQRGDAAREPGTVIVADQNEDVRSLLAPLFEQEGWQVIGVEDGATAQRACPSADAIVLSGELRDMHPLELIERMRSTVAGVDLPMIVVGSVVDRSSAERAGADDWIPHGGKPLVEAVRRAVRAPARRLVLVVEDDPDLRGTIGRLVRRAGYSPLVVRTASEGLTLLRQRLPAVLITDLHLPGPDGLTLVRAVRGDQTSAALPVIVITGYADRATEDGCDRLGAVMVRKPFDEEQLRRQVERLLPPA